MTIYLQISDDSVSHPLPAAWEDRIEQLGAGELYGETWNCHCGSVHGGTD